MQHPDICVVVDMDQKISTRPKSVCTVPFRIRDAYTRVQVACRSRVAIFHMAKIVGKSGWTAICRIDALVLHLCITDTF